MLNFEDLTLRRGSRLLFEGVGIQVHPGQKVGIVGANGSGKSSLFELILGGLESDVGTVTYPPGWVVSHVAQEIPADFRATIAYVMEGDRELHEVQARLLVAENANDGHRVADLHGRLEHIDGYRARSRAAKLLHGLGFDTHDEERPVTDFSGGWRARLSLARALMCRSDLLLLDEPTNHLDLDAIIWLEAWLKTYPGTLLLVSHDREFLDAVADHIAHIEHHGICLYKGNYSDFERRRAEQLTHQEASYLRQQREIAHIKSYIDRFRAKASKARQAQSRLKSLERMALIAPAHVDSPFHFGFRPPEKTPRPLLRVDSVATGYAGHAILEGIRLVLSPGDRIGLLGRNGAGKSTLVRLLADAIQPLCGRMERAQDLKVGYFAQHQMEQLHAEHSAVQHLLQIDGSLAEPATREYLGGFGFSGDRALQPVGTFSGGEKSRLVLALLVHLRPNLLLLDEPTNHLDLEMRQALAQALQDFEGAMVIISHDRHLLKMTTDTLLLVHAGRVDEFDGSLEDYPAWLNDQRRHEQPVSRPDHAPNRRADERKDRKRDAAQRRRQLAPLRQEITALERRLEHIELARRTIQERLLDERLYQPDRAPELVKLHKQMADLDAELANVENAWLIASEALDEALAQD